MKDSSSDILVILVLLVTLIGGGAAIQIKRQAAVPVLYDIDDFPTVDISLAIDEAVEEDPSCYRLLK